MGMGLKRKKRAGNARKSVRKNVGSPFDGYVANTLDLLNVLVSEHGFAPAEVHIHIPECAVTYRAPDLWVNVTYEYSTPPFCTFGIERQDGGKVRIGYDNVAESLGFRPWESPSTFVDFDAAPEVIRSNLSELINVVNAIRTNDVQTLLHDELWRKYS